MIKLWIDDIRLPPHEGEWIWVRTVNSCKNLIDSLTFNTELVLSIDHDSSVYHAEGGDYINILNWLEYRQHNQNGKIYPIRIHSFNPVGCVNMRAIIERNGWEEIR